MKELVYEIVKVLVDNPENIKIDEIVENNVVTIKLSVDQSDMGKVIGRNGKIAKSIRTVLKAAATKENVLVNLDIVD